MHSRSVNNDAASTGSTAFFAPPILTEPLSGPLCSIIIFSVIKTPPSPIIPPVIGSIPNEGENKQRRRENLLNPSLIYNALPRFVFYELKQPEVFLPEENETRNFNKSQFDISRAIAFRFL
jgi:hypothetical protein